MTLDEIWKSEEIFVSWQIGKVKSKLSAHLYFEIARLFEDKLKLTAVSFINANRVYLDEASKKGMKLWRIN